MSWSNKGATVEFQNRLERLVAKKLPKFFIIEPSRTMLVCKALTYRDRRLSYYFRFFDLTFIQSHKWNNREMLILLLLASVNSQVMVRQN